MFPETIVFLLQDGVVIASTAHKESTFNTLLPPSYNVTTTPITQETHTKVRTRVHIKYIAQYCSLATIGISCLTAPSPGPGRKYKSAFFILD